MSRHVRLSFMDGLALEIRADRKTETRRIIQGVPADVVSPEEGFVNLDGDGYLWGRSRYLDRDADGEAFEGIEDRTFPIRPRVHPDDILDVCEALVPLDQTEGRRIVRYRADDAIYWDYAEPTRMSWRWKILTLPARYCPSWAVRTHRRIVSVHPERLSEITDAGARAEGIAALGWEPTREGFVRGFRELHGLGEDADPWVWVIRWAPGEVSA